MPSVSAPESRFPETANLSRCEDNKIIPNITHTCIYTCIYIRASTCINVRINGTFNLLCRIVFRGREQYFCRTCMADGTEMAGEPGRTVASGTDWNERDGLERAGRDGRLVAAATHLLPAICYLLPVTCYLFRPVCKHRFPPHSQQVFL